MKAAASTTQSVRTAISELEALLRRKRTAAALTRLQQKPLERTAAYASAVALFGRHADVASAQQVFDMALKRLEDTKERERRPPATPKARGSELVRVYNAMLYTHATRQDVSSVRSLLQLMHMRGLAPDVQSHIELVRALLSPHPLEAEAQLRRWEQEPIAKQRVPFHLLLRGYGRSGDDDGVLRVLQWMRSLENVAPDWVTYTLALAACGSRDAAMRVYDDLRKYVGVPSLVLYDYLTMTLIRVGAADDALRMFEKRLTEQLPLSVYTCAQACTALARLGMTARIVEVVRECGDRRDVPINRQLIITAILAVLQSEQQAPVFELYDYARHRLIKPDSRMMGLVVEASLSSPPAKCDEVWADAQRYSCSASPHVVVPRACFLIGAGDRDAAMGLLHAVPAAAFDERLRQIRSNNAPRVQELAALVEGMYNSIREG